VETGARTIVIDPKPTADIEVTERVAELRKLCVIAGRLPHCTLDRRNVGHLRADMKMDELQQPPDPLRFQIFARRDQVRCAESELCVLSATRRPFSSAFTMQPHPDADV